MLQTCSGPGRILLGRAELRFQPEARRQIYGNVTTNYELRTTVHAPRFTPHGPRSTIVEVT
ncbi:MAG: hypothetical protein ACK5TO_15580, partial [Planctomycetaceae bacterium]